MAEKCGCPLNFHNRTQKTVTLSGGTPEITAYAYGDGSTASTANSNQLVSFTKPDTSVVAFTYDLNGNRATRTESGETDTYSYDYENRLLGLDYQTGSTDTGLYEYGYDYRTRRVDRDESAVTGRDRSLIVFSGGTSAQEHTTAISSNPAVENIRGSDYGGGIGGILYTLRSGAPSFKHYNSRGDIVAATDDLGSLTYQAAYEAFGKHGDTPSSQEWGNTADRQQANTKDEDPTGLLNEGFRYRDLETGTFITRDPLGFIDGPNVYTYVVQNPWTHFDPLGLQKGRRPPNHASRGPNVFQIARSSFVENFSGPADLIRGGFAGEFDGLNVQAVVVGTISLAAATVETGVDIATLGATTAPKQILKTGVRELAKEGVEQLGREAVETSIEKTAKDVAQEGAEDYGVVYLRKDQNGEYVGKAKNRKRYDKRQQEHNDANPDAEYEYTELERVPHDSSRKLEVAEEDWIRAGGGPTNKSNPDGALQNKRHEMNEQRYRESGGDIDE